MSRKNIILVAGILGVALIFLVLSQVLFKKTATPAPVVNTTPTVTEETEPTTTKTESSAFPLDTSTIDSLALQAKSEFDFAFGKAKEWRADATPMAVSIKYTGGIAQSKGKNTYIFFAPSLSQYYFTVTIDQAKNDIGENNFQRVIYFRDDYFLPKDIVVLPIKYWTKSYLDVLQKADALGGNEIRTKNANYDVSLLLSAQTGKYIQWDIEYSLEGTKMFSVQLSANTGEEFNQ